jgi:hypothetical protein
MGKAGYFARLTAPAKSAPAVLMPSSRPVPMAEPAGWGEAAATEPPPVAASAARMRETNTDIKTPARPGDDVQASAPNTSPPAASMGPPENAELQAAIPKRPEFTARPRVEPGTVEPVSARVMAAQQATRTADSRRLVLRDQESSEATPASSPKIPELPSIFTIPPIATPAETVRDVADDARPYLESFRSGTPGTQRSLGQEKMADGPRLYAGVIRPTVYFEIEKAPLFVAPGGAEPEATQGQPPVISIGVVEVRAPAPVLPQPAAPARAAPAGPPKALARAYGSAFGFGQS